MKNNDKRKIVIIASIVVVLVILLSGLIIFWGNKPNNKVEGQKTVDATEYYYCYNSKKEDVSCGGVDCKFTCYYKFKIVNGEDDEEVYTQHVDGTYVAEYEFKEEDIDKVETKDFILENSEYKFDAKTSTYRIEKNLIIQPPFSVAFSIESEMNHLKELGFTECEVMYE